MIARAWTRLRSEPRLPVILFVVLAAPSLLGLLPFDRALAPWLDLAPVARGFAAHTLDDTLVGELFTRGHGLAGTLTGGLLVALLVAGPAMWLAEVLVALRALESRVPTGWACARGLGLALAALPLRGLPALLGASLLWTVRDAQTFAAAWPMLLFAFAAYVITSAFVTVLVDVARGLALSDEARGFASCLAVALKRVPLQLVALELASMAGCVAVVLCTRPLGIFHGAMLLLGLGALALRAAVVTVVVGAAATTGAASRSG